MRKWTYPYLEVLVEQVRKKNEIFRSPGRAEVRKAELLIWQSRADVQKLNFISLAAQAGRKCGSRTSNLTKNWQSRSVNVFHVTSLIVRPNGSAGAEFQIFGSPIKLEVWKQNFTSLTGPYPTDCHCQC